MRWVAPAASTFFRIIDPDAEMIDTEKRLIALIAERFALPVRRH
jgi:hypothetical protein